MLLMMMCLPTLAITKFIIFRLSLRYTTWGLGNFELKLEITSGDSLLGGIFNFSLESMSKY